MDKEKFLKVLRFYWYHSSLKDLERTGWKKWNVSGRRESVSEYISKAQGLALALYSEFDELKDINIERVITMLSVHEEGEPSIGDITPYDGVTDEEKAIIEREAVVSAFSYLKRSSYFISLFDEFEARETKEAKLAYICDKLDPDLQAQDYSHEGRCTIQNATYEIVSNPKIQEIIKNGAITVGDVFLEADKPKYEGTFLEDFYNSLKELLS